MPAPVAPVLDNFNRANENPLTDGGQWTGPVTGGGNFKVVSNQAQGALPATCVDFWNPLSLNDQEAVVDLVSGMAYPYVYDDFTRANEAPISGGGVWTIDAGTGGALKVVSNQAAGSGTASNASALSGVTVTDCEVEATIATVPGAGNQIGVTARTQINSGRDMYLAHYSGSGGVVLLKIVANVQTSLGTATVTLVAGDKIRINCTGTTISASYFHSGAWTQFASVTDTAFASGSIGAFIRQTTGRLTNFTVNSGYDGNQAGPMILTSNATGNNSSQRGYAALCMIGLITLYRQGSGGTLTSLGTSSQTLGAGDSVGVQSIGTTINVWYRPSGGSWSLVITATDSTFTSGSPGMRTRTSSGLLDNFAAGISAGEVDPPFISSVTTVHAPILATIPLSFIASVTAVHAPSLQQNVAVPFISSATTVYALTTQGDLAVPFIGSTTAVYAPTLPQPEVDVPFISSHTHVYSIFSLFDPNKTYGGPGNGGEAFLVALNANGVTTTATLAADISATSSTLTLTGDSGFPPATAIVVTIDDEELYIYPNGSGNYNTHGRGLGNTTPDAHTAGATVSWDDTYNLAILATENINASFTANVDGSGSILYPGWLICFDSSQAYLSGDRYPMHVTEVLGVFDAGTGVSGTSKLDGAQPNAICTPTGASDDCPAALSNPARIQTDIVPGDVAVVAYENPEASMLALGPRSTALQSWFGMKRVDLTDHDVTFTDPNGIVVDTTGTYDTFTGSINGEWFEPNMIGVAPQTGLPTPNNVPFTSVTLPGTDRKFTFGSGGGGYDETGWPICCLAVRQGTKRVPAWESWDWHNYNYVYCGFGTDDTYAQILVNRNGIIFGSVPVVDLPGPQDIPGPEAVWDDKEYYFGASWYVAIYNGVYLIIGPSIGGQPSPGGEPGDPGYVPTVTFPGGTPGVIVPPFVPPVEGGAGGGIENPLMGMHVWGTSGKGFA